MIATGTDTERLAGLGAVTVIDRANGPVAEQVLAEHPGGVDALINLFGRSIDDVPLAAVRRGGTVATLGQAPPDAEAAAAAGVTLHRIMAKAVREVTGPLADQAATGNLRMNINNVIPLNEALDALATIAVGRASGKTVVTLDN